MRKYVLLAAALLSAVLAASCTNADTAKQPTADAVATTVPSDTAALPEDTAVNSTANTSSTDQNVPETTVAVFPQAPTVYDGQIDISDFEYTEETSVSAAESTSQTTENQSQPESTPPPPAQPATEPDGYQSVVVRP